MKPFQKRHLYKTITWRLIGSFDTFILSNWINREMDISLSIVISEVFSKSILYYFHERFWFNSSITNTRIRHLIKPFSWRLIATIDTFLISSFFFGDFYKGAQLSLLELLTKVILYYIHDKAWYYSKIGLDHGK